MIEASSQKRYIIGAKQVIKAVKADKVSKVYIASDSDPVIIEPVAKEASARGISVGYISTRKQLGEMCGIRVKASCAAAV